MEKNKPIIKSIYDVSKNSIKLSLPKPTKMQEHKYYLRSIGYEEIGKKAKPFKWKYDCSYIGTAHPQKYEGINQMTKALKDLMPRQYIYHYMPSCLKYVYHKLFAEEFRSARFFEFQKEKLPISMATKIFEQSKCILDAPQAGQRGLTIRTIECLGAKRKLITTNTDCL